MYVPNYSVHRNNIEITFKGLKLLPGIMNKHNNAVVMCPILNCTQNVTRCSKSQSYNYISTVDDRTSDNITKHTLGTV